MDDGMTSMANWALNKAPGGRNGLDNPRPTRSFVLFQGPPHPVTPPRSTRSQAVTNPRKTGHQASELRKVKGSAINPGSEYGDGILAGALLDIDGKRGVRQYQLPSG
jgi:hypothetical protein